jgi:hypothetical protein
VSQAGRIAKWTALGASVVFVLIQAVPYGRDHTNPAVNGEPSWNAPRTRELFYRACKDCHSHETVWPWYSWVAPASWLVQSDVDEARHKFDVSYWARPKQAGREAATMVSEGEMPPLTFRLAHPEARLSAAERAELIAGLTATFGTETNREPGGAGEKGAPEGEKD